MRRIILALGGLVCAWPALAVQFELDYFEGIDGTLNTNMTLGAAIRMQKHARCALVSVGNSSKFSISLTFLFSEKFRSHDASQLGSE